MDVSIKTNTLSALLLILLQCVLSEPLPLWLGTGVFLLVVLASFYYIIARKYLLIPAVIFATTIAHFQWRHSLVWPAAQSDEFVHVSGEIVSIPESTERGQKFRLHVHALDGNALGFAQGFDVNLSHFEREQQVSAGQLWQFYAKLKPPRASVNFHGFDYERWLFSQHVSASGYVKLNDSQRIGESAFSIERWRSALSASVRKTGLDYTGLIEGITIGIDSGISSEQWQRYRATGTIHLIVISGMHLTLFAGVFAWMVSWCWRRFPRLCLLMPAQRAGIIGGFIGALAYAAIAGFGIAVVRALWMMAVVAFAMLRKQRFASIDILACAVLGMLLVDPCAVLEAGFWLSVVAVIVLLMIADQQLNDNRFWWKLLRLQLLLSFALLPLTAMQFGVASVISPVSNLLAVPWVSLVSTPLALFGVFLTTVSDTFAYPLLWLANQSLWIFDQSMTWLAGLVIAQWNPKEVGVFVWFFVCAAVWLWLMPWTPWRCLAPLLALPLLLHLASPHSSDTELVIHDVGQGLALTLYSDDFSFVYDAGPASGNYDAGEMVLAPYWHAMGVSKLDNVWISHGDNDHAGGVRALLREFEVNQLYAGEPLPSIEAMPCRAGQVVQNGDARVNVLYPDDQQKKNAASCVLMMEAEGVKILFTGDIGRKQEHALLKKYADLKADILIVAHHGSNGSSTEEFIDAVRPSLSIVSAGYKNAHGHPRTQVLERLRAVDSGILNTAEVGAIRLRLKQGQYHGDLARSRSRIWRARMEPSSPL